MAQKELDVNKVKLSGVVVWSEAKEVKIGEEGKALVHRYLVSNTIKTKNEKEISATFVVVQWLAADSKARLFVNNDQVMVTGVLTINYRPALTKDGKEMTEKGKDGKEYKKTYKDVEIRAESVEENMPF